MLTKLREVGYSNSGCWIWTVYFIKCVRNESCDSIKSQLHGPGIEPGPPAWQARILPLNHPCSGRWRHLKLVTITRIFVLFLHTKRTHKHTHIYVCVCACACVRYNGSVSWYFCRETLCKVDDIQQNKRFINVGGKRCWYTFAFGSFEK